MRTNYKRLVIAVIIGYTMLSVSLLTPALVLLSVRIIKIDPLHYTTTFGLCSAIGTIFAIIAPPLGGALGDRTKCVFGRRRTWILTGGIVGALGILLMGFSTNLITLISGWVVVQFFYNIAGASFAGLMPDQVPVEHRASYSGLIGIVQPLGVLIGMILATLLNQSYPIVLWVILALFGVCGPIITCLLISDKPADEALLLKKNQASFKEKIVDFYPSPKKFPNYTKAILLKICFLMGYGTGTYLTIMLAQRLGMSADHAGKVISLINIVGLVLTAIASVAGGFLADRYKQQRIFIAAGGIFMFCGLFIHMFATTVPIVIAGSCFVALGFGLFNSADAALVMRVLPNPDDAGKDVGLMASANNVQGVLVPLLAPALLGIGSWYTFFGGLSIFIILGVVVLYTIPEDKRVQEEEIKNELV